MSNITLHHENVKKWFSDNGDNTHNLNYELNENSIVVEVGGFTGVWSQQIIDKFNCKIYIVEPIQELFTILSQKFEKNDKVKILKKGISSENKKGTIYYDKDGSSSHFSNNNPKEIEFITVDSLLEYFGLNHVDLVQINIEGEEYSVLENMIETGIINKFNNIQVQFHLGIENDISRRENIRKNLIKNNFRLNFDYPFVWESWKK